MKCVRYRWCAAIVLAGMLSAVAFSQSSPTAAQNTVVTGTSSVTPSQGSPEPSLGSYARALRKDKAQHAAKSFDNDSLPKDDKISVVGADSASSQAAASNDDTQAQSAASDPEKPKVMPGQTQEQRQQVYEKWQDKITAQQSQVDSIAHELDLDQREYRLRAASFYADAGNRLRNEGAWDKEDTDYKQKIAEKQKALDDAKAKLSDMQEDARKAGLPSSAQQPGQDDNSGPE